MKQRKRPLKSIIDNEALNYAMYTVENRAIPHIIDGLKPVHRFFLYSTIKNANKSFNKVAAVAGRVSEYGYGHGENSAADAGQLMANDWNNNLPIIKGRGNFGSRMVQDMAAARYTYCCLHENFFKVFKDINVSPEHEDPEHVPPKYYLPVIPFVLLNGIYGIATGFATDIIPHCPEDVARCTKKYIESGELVNPKFKFPEFKGNMVTTGNNVILEGTYEFVGKTKLIITEIPYKYERSKYVELLDKLKDSDTIVRYDDRCGKDNFRFEITLKRDFKSDHENIMKVFKLRQSVTQNLTVLDWDYKLREYDNSSELIKDFVEHRIKFVEKRIDFETKSCEDKLSLANAKIEFIEKVISEVIVLKGKTRKQALKEIETWDNLKNHSNELIGMNIYHLTNDEIAKLKKDATELNRQLKYWKKTTPKIEFVKDLDTFLGD